MKSSIRLFRIAGIDIGIHYSWLFIFFLISWSLAQGYFPLLYPGWSTITYWITSVTAAITLFISVLIHELAHSLVARAQGMSVNSITLFLFGGVSNLQEEPEQPKAEFIMAIVGPLSSLALAGMFWGLTRIVNPENMLGALVGYLAIINLILSIFNLLPGLPLDGGRVLRSIIWATTKSLSKATNIASFTGRVFGWVLISFGLIQLLGGNILGGIWIAFIGWFLNNAADSARKESTLREYLTNIKVKDIMKPNPVTVSPDILVEQVVSGMFHGQNDRAVPVCRNGQLIGIASISDIRKLPRDKWMTTTVGNIMTSKPLFTVSPEDTLYEAFRLIAQHDLNQVLITQQGQCSGILNRAEIIRHLSLTSELGKAN